MPGKVWLLVAGVAVSALACSVPLSEAPAKTSGAATGPKHGGVLSYRADIDPIDWDPSTGSKTDQNMAGRAWQSLIAFKAGPDVGWGDFILRPNLAESWEASPDAKRFTYHLRKGVTFASQAPVNGRELTAADVKYSYEYWAREGQFKGKPEGTFSFFFEGMTGIDTPDPYTVIIRFADPFVPFLNYSASGFVPIVPHEIADRDGNFSSQVLGTGPFMFNQAASQKGTRWVWDRNPNYWEPGLPYLDQVRDVVISDDSSAYAAFQTGQLDMLSQGIPVRDGEEILQKDPTAVGLLYLEATGREMYMNPKQTALGDVRVRQAINAGIDRDEFVKVATDGRGGWALAGALSTTYTQDEIKQMIPYTPDRAKQLLAQAGYPNGVDIQFEYPTDRGRQEVTEAELLQSQLKKIGVNLTLKPMPYAEFSTQKKAKQHSMSIITRSYAGDIDYGLYRIFYPTSKNNYDAIDDPRLSQLLDAQRQEPDPAKREQIVREAVRYINVEIAAGRALYFPAFYMIWKSYVKNFGPQKGQAAHYLTETWMDK